MVVVVMVMVVVMVVVVVVVVMVVRVVVAAVLCKSKCCLWNAPSTSLHNSSCIAAATLQ